MISGRFSFIVGLVLAFSVVSGCGNASDNGSGVVIQPGNVGTSPNQPQAQTVAEALARYDAAQGAARLDYGTSLLGIDANANGVRDDVEGFMQTLMLTEPERRGMLQWARALQAALSINSADPAAVASGVRSMDRGGNCLARVIVSGSVSDLMNSVTEATYNTPERLSAYMRFDEASSGISVDIPASGNCD